MRRIASILAVVTILSSCEEGEMIYINNFNGFTPRDTSGIATGTIDTTDWTIFDKWNDDEKNLFLQTFDTFEVTVDTISVIAYPNPANAYINIDIQKPEGFYISYRVVDKFFHVMDGSDSVTEQHFQVDLSANIKKEPLRIYYQVIRNDQAYMGHGDVVVVE